LKHAEEEKSLQYSRKSQLEDLVKSLRSRVQDLETDSKEKMLSSSL